MQLDIRRGGARLYALTLMLTTSLEISLLHASSAWAEERSDGDCPHPYEVDCRSQER
jgi:hypothetical protein